MERTDIILPRSRARRVNNQQQVRFPLHFFHRPINQLNHGRPPSHPSAQDQVGRRQAVSYACCALSSAVSDNSLFKEEGIYREEVTTAKANLDKLRDSGADDADVRQAVSASTWCAVVGASAWGSAILCCHRARMAADGRGRGIRRDCGMWRDASTDVGTCWGVGALLATSRSSCDGGV